MKGRNYLLGESVALGESWKEWEAVSVPLVSITLSACACILDPDTCEIKSQGLSGQLIDTACKVCQAYLGQLEHEDIDVSDNHIEALSDEEWNDLTHQYYLLVQ